MKPGLRSDRGVDAPPRQKPRLRGVFHLVAACVAVPVVLALWNAAGSTSARWGAGVYGASLCALFTISAVYHRPTWPPRTRDLLGRIDQSAIFLLIAGTYTPFGLLAGPSGSHALLLVVWSGALGGCALALAWPAAPKPLMAGLYVLFAWAMTGLVPSLHHTAGMRVLGLVLLGGLVYTAGAIVYAVQRPDPFPRIFGYHEIFHLFVVAAAALHFAAVWLTLPLLTAMA
jgi:hemolysin III